MNWFYGEHCIANFMKIEFEFLNKAIGITFRDSYR